MKTLEAHNLERQQAYEQEYERIRKAKEPKPNGIICPNCEGELWDSDPTITFCSNPPKTHIHCPRCGFKGYRIK